VDLTLPVRRGGVTVLTGEHSGRVGLYCDDDEVSGLAVVYLADPFTSERFYFSHWNLQNVTVLWVERWKKKNADICKAMGIK